MVMSNKKEQILFPSDINIALIRKMKKVKIVVYNNLFELHNVFINDKGKWIMQENGTSEEITDKSVMKRLHFLPSNKYMICVHHLDENV